MIWYGIQKNCNNLKVVENHTNLETIGVNIFQRKFRLIKLIWNFIHWKGHKMPYEYELLKNKTFKSESIFRLKHYHGISPENNHPDVIFVSCLGKFGGFVQNEIHEWVKATQNAFYRPASIDLQLDLKYEKISCKNI